MIVKKITQGWVMQEYDLELKRWVSQEFVASDDVQWEDEDGEHVDRPSHSYLPFVMVQPNEVTCVRWSSKALARKLKGN